MQASMCSPQSSALTPDEQAVWTVLARHRGRASAIGLDVVAAIADLSERRVQQSIAALIEVHGRPIGSACTRPMGYFLIETDAELIESVSQLTHRVRALVRRIAALQKSTGPLVLQQLALELTEDAA